jgi:hypothetical protein
VIPQQEKRGNKMAKTQQKKSRGAQVAFDKVGMVLPYALAIRLEPNEEGGLLTLVDGHWKLYMEGQRVHYSQVDDDWLQTEDGYIPARYVEDDPSAPTPEPDDGDGGDTEGGQAGDGD